MLSKKNKSDPKTICINCKHCMDEYNIPLCEVYPIKFIVDNVTGKRCSPHFKFCKDVNKGNCKQFEQKPEKFDIRMIHKLDDLLLKIKSLVLNSLKIKHE